MQFTPTYLECAKRQHMRNSILCSRCKLVEMRQYCNDSKMHEIKVDKGRYLLSVLLFGEQPMFEGITEDLFNE